MWSTESYKAEVIKTCSKHASTIEACCLRFRSERIFRMWIEGKVEDGRERGKAIEFDWKLISPRPLLGESCKVLETRSAKEFDSRSWGMSSKEEEARTGLGDSFEGRIGANYSQIRKLKQKESISFELFEEKENSLIQETPTQNSTTHAGASAISTPSTYNSLAETLKRSSTSGLNHLPLRSL